jgi:hypothetical protein
VKWLPPLLPPLFNWPAVAFMSSVTVPLLPLPGALCAIQPGEFGTVAPSQSVLVLVLLQTPELSPLAHVEEPVAAWMFAGFESCARQPTMTRND